MVENGATNILPVKHTSYVLQRLNEQRKKGKKLENLDSLPPRVKLNTELVSFIIVHWHWKQKKQRSIALIYPVSMSHVLF